MPRINSRGIKHVPIESRHVRWAWQRSPDDYMKVRYHIIIVSDKGREQIRDIIFDQVQRRGMAVESPRETEGNVRNSRLKYLLVTFDTPLAPREIDWTKVPTPTYFERRLYERRRRGFSIESFVEGLYS